MSGIYIHIPFCKQACHYCDFHFSTSLKKKEEMLDAIRQELILRRSESKIETIETIYFGGGTPSLLLQKEIDFILETVFQNYKVAKNPEITLEANPDDLNLKTITELGNSQINRLSIGVQSFFEEDLQMMNRAHNSAEAKKCLQLATEHFDNISVDLIYGIPGMTNAKWKQNIQTVLDFNIPHISSYALTVEPKTALQKFIAIGKIAAPKEEVAQEHFEILVEMLTNKGFIHYEISNFGKEKYFSKNNSSYWLGKKYLGIGPSAHSFDGVSRSWNLANNAKYIIEIQKGNLPSETEILSIKDRYNEYVMTGLRTIWGVSLEKVSNDFGSEFLDYLTKNADNFIKQELLVINNNTLKTTKNGLFLVDGIASDLFFIG
ncbi:MAG: oxygen-independent coproporphyrinogen-3 oxidase [Flavobacterium sp.]|jgi:oxygen-independent coproporphyrinogen-3 oxidase